MTRFKQEISGRLGDFWKRNAQEEVKKAVVQANEKATVEADGPQRTAAFFLPIFEGAIRWQNPICEKKMS